MEGSFSAENVSVSGERIVEQPNISALNPTPHPNEEEKRAGCMDEMSKKSETADCISDELEKKGISSEIKKKQEIKRTLDGEAKPENAEQLFMSLDLRHPVTQARLTSLKELEALVLETSGGCSDKMEHKDMDGQEKLIAERRIVEEILDEAVELRARTSAEREIAEISKLNPDIQSIEDLAQIKQYQTLLGHVKKGNSLLEAYQLACFTELTIRKQKAGRQAAINSLANRSHLKRTAVQDARAADVPQAVIKQYRKILPGLSENEIKRHYLRYDKENG